ncbi:gliding motility-associated C-terminal domain-containing protein [Aquiflexum sp.]|uniref:T9SS type B sorting domain-containing protein n=1 Tax=Aquiflexum sp. TaxID=1872584 RepID=UPI003593E7CC
MKRHIFTLKVLFFLILSQAIQPIVHSQSSRFFNLSFATKNDFAKDKNFDTHARVNAGPGDAIMSVNVSGQLALCTHNDRGHIILDIIGGVPPYTFRWNNLETVQNRYNLLSGTYSVWIKDSLGYEIQERIVVQPPFPLVIEMANTKEASCMNSNDGEAKINILKGRGEPYKIEWSNGLKNQMHAKGLTPGTYSVKVSDQFECNQTIYFEIKTSHAEMHISEELTNVSCSNGDDGSISVQVSGGKSPYNYQWSNGVTTKSNKGLNPGNYDVLITDAGGCSVFRTFQVEASSPIEISGEVKSELLCFHSEEGFISLNVEGGIAPYTYDWSNGGKTNKIQNLGPGEYGVKVTDANGCSEEKIFNIAGPEKLTAKIETALDINCELGEAKGVAWVTIKGGKAPYKVHWQNGSDDIREIQIADEKEIAVEVTDAFGCTVMETVTVDFSIIAAAERLEFNYRKLDLDFEDEISVDEPLLFESAIAEDFIAWEWDFGDGTKSNEKDPIHIFKKPGEFEVVLRAYDMFGCSSVLTEEVRIKEYQEFFLMPNAFSPNADGLNDRFHPVMKGVADYKMDIFNNWGEHLYSSAGRGSEGWDGFLNGQLLPNGNYVYKVNYTTSKGEEIQKSGTVTLIR